MLAAILRLVPDFDDIDPAINSSRPELLNGIDDDCDNRRATISRYRFRRSLGYDEYYVHGTNQANSDTDGDGLIDGDEANIHSTDPLVAT